MLNWITPSTVSVGQGTAKEVSRWIQSPLGNSAIITGSRSKSILESLQIPMGTSPSFLHISQTKGEPELEQVLDNVRVAKAHNICRIAAIGGGSVIDMAKAIAALSGLPDNEDPIQYLEVIGAGKPLPNPALPVMAVPTTAGSGAEATKNAVIASSSHKVKVSLRHPSMVPSMVLLDPDLSLTMPPRITASTGMDALTQLLEAYITQKRNDYTDALCLKGLNNVSTALNRVMDNPEDVNSRQSMLIAGYFSGVALANAGLGAVHGFAGPMGGMFTVPHGEVCASLLPAVVEMNIKLIDSLNTEHRQDLTERLSRIAEIFLANGNSNYHKLPDYFYNLKRDFSIRSIEEMGVEKKDWKTLIEKSMKASSMKGNPVKLSHEQLEAILLNS